MSEEIQEHEPEIDYTKLVKARLRVMKCKTCFGQGCYKVKRVSKGANIFHGYEKCGCVRSLSNEELAELGKILRGELSDSDHLRTHDKEKPTSSPQES